MPQLSNTVYDAIDAATTALETVASPVPELASPVAGVRATLLKMKPIVIDPQSLLPILQTIDLRRLVCDLKQYQGWERYIREIIDAWWRANLAYFDFAATDEKAGGVRKPWQYPAYRVRACSWDDFVAAGYKPTGPIVATWAATPGVTAGTARAPLINAVALDAIPDGINVETCEPLDAAGNVVPYVYMPMPNSNESFPAFLVINDRKGRAVEDKRFFLQLGSYDHTHATNHAVDGAADGRAEHAFIVLPDELAFTLPQLIAPRDYPRMDDPLLNITLAQPQGKQPVTYNAAKMAAINYMPDLIDLHRTQVVPFTTGNTWTPQFTKDEKVETTGMRQGYFPDDLRLRFPSYISLDGLRNIATFRFGTWCWGGHNQGVYASDPWGIYHFLAKTHERITLVGYRHNAARPPAIGELQVPGVAELVGNWNGVPVERRGIFGLWGPTFNRRSIRQGRAGNPTINGDPVHDTDVIMYGGTDFNNILQFTMDGRDPNRGTAQMTPAVVTELVPPCPILSGGWYWCEHYNDVLYVAVRRGHGIAMFRARGFNDDGMPATNDGEFLGWLKREPTAGSHGYFQDTGVPPGQKHFQRWKPYPNSTLAQRRALSVIDPECIRIVEDVNGVPFFTDSGLAQIEVNRQQLDVSNPDLPVLVGARVAYGRPTPSNSDKDHFCVHDIARDNSFGPRGMCATGTFSETQHGRPELWIPNTPANGVVCGQRYHYNDFGDPRFCPSGANNVAGGRGGCYERDVYAMLFGFGPGFLMETGSSDGLGVFSLAQAVDPLPVMKVIDAGAKKYMRAALMMPFGTRGHSKFGLDRSMLPEPFKSDPDVNGYLDHCERA